MTKIIAWFKAWYLGALKSFGYPLIAFLMAIESSIVPVPSELVIPPAAHWAHTNQVPLGIVGIVIAGTLGSWLGATAMYWVSRWAGRPLVMRYGRYVMISEAKVAVGGRTGAPHGPDGPFFFVAFSCARRLSRLFVRESSAECYT